jgi:hypothetical protein
MKGKQLFYKDILKLPENTEVLVINEDNQKEFCTIKCKTSRTFKLVDNNHLYYFHEGDIIRNFI